MNTGIFERLIEHAVNEISGRYPEYFSLCAVDMASPPEIATRFHRESAFSDCSMHELADALTKGVALLKQRGILLRPATTETDGAAEVLVASMMDAFLAADGQLPLVPPEAAATDPKAIHSTPGGVDYFLTDGPDAVLLIISATGVPARIWGALLADRTLRRRYLIVQSQAGPLLTGGTPHPSSLWGDISNILSVLKVVQPRTLDVLTWCDGARTGMELARHLRQGVSSLTLLSPTFHGNVDPLAYPSQFEDDLREICSMLGQDPDTDRLLLGSVAASAGGGADELSRNPVKLRRAILALPPHAHVDDLLRPLSTVEHYRNYIARLLQDEAYDVHSCLRELECPLLCITGSQDTIVNTKAVEATLNRSAGRGTHLSLAGAGHHIHLLQYQYLQYALACFLSGSTPRDTARISVRTLPAAQASSRNDKPAIHTPGTARVTIA